MTLLLKSLGAAFICSLVYGFIILNVLLILFSEMQNGEDIFHYFMHIFLNIIGAGFLCVAYYLPVAIIEKDRIGSGTFEELIRRYLPLLTLPIGLLFCVILYAESGVENSGNHYFFTIKLLCLLSMAYVGLFTFLKKIKSEQP